MAIAGPISTSDNLVRINEFRYPWDWSVYGCILGALPAVTACIRCSDDPALTGNSNPRSEMLPVTNSCPFTVTACNSLPSNRARTPLRYSRYSLSPDGNGNRTNFEYDLTGRVLTRRVSRSYISKIRVPSPSRTSGYWMVR